MKLDLIDRIAELTGIETVECNDDTVPRQVDVFLATGPADGVRKPRTPLLFCSLNCKGVSVSGLDDWARHQVISKGWGKLKADRVLLFLPRNRSELDVCWHILQRAYQNLYVPSAPGPTDCIVSTWDWPRHSRTSLQ